MDLLIIMDKGSAISFLRSFISLDDILSRPLLILGFNSLIFVIISRLSVGCKNHELGQLLPIKYSLNCLVDGPMEAAHCLPISVKYEQNALLILDLSSVWVLVMLKI